jgi:Plasmid pRiA4b ORF-3-like protein
MAGQAYVFDAKLSGWRGVHRTIAIRCEATLGDLHHALQHAFGWGDDHLYAFWLGRKFSAKHKTGYVHPLALEADWLTGDRTQARQRRKSAECRLDRLRLTPGRRLAYLFDFQSQWRVRLTLREITSDDGGQYPRVVASVGDAPPQDISFDELAEAA